MGSFTWERDRSQGANRRRLAQHSELIVDSLKSINVCLQPVTGSLKICLPIVENRTKDRPVDLVSKNKQRMFPIQELIKIANGTDLLDHVVSFLAS